VRPLNFTVRRREDVPVDESWVSVAQFSDPASARVASSRLTAENVPNAVSRPPFAVGLYYGVYYLRVPPESVGAAKEILEADARLGEEELEDLALHDSVPDDFVPPTTSTPGDPQARHLRVLMPIGSSVLFLFFAGNFAVVLTRMIDKGVQYPTFCTAAGCRSSLNALFWSGLGALVMLGALLASLGIGKQDK
jgi:hypothetical protein